MGKKNQKGNKKQEKKQSQPMPPKEPEASLSTEDRSSLSEENYVICAEECIKELIQKCEGSRDEDREKKDKKEEKVVTTTQLRKLLSLTMDIYNELIADPETKQELSKDLIMRMNYLKLRFIYECGRTPAVKNFVDTSGLLNHLTWIMEDKKEQRMRFILFTRYMEALVAYRKYLVADGD